MSKFVDCQRGLAPPHGGDDADDDGSASAASGPFRTASSHDDGADDAPEQQPQQRRRSDDNVTPGTATLGTGAAAARMGKVGSTMSLPPDDPYVDGVQTHGPESSVRFDGGGSNSGGDIEGGQGGPGAHPRKTYRAARSRHLLLQSLLAQRERLLTRLRGLPPQRAARIFPVIHSGQVALLQTLLQNQIVSVAETDYNGSTPLHVAAHTGSDAMVQILLSYGADVHALDAQERTAMDLAYANGHSFVVRILADAAKAAAAAASAATPPALVISEPSMAQFDIAPSPYNGPDMQPSVVIPTIPKGQSMAAAFDDAASDRGGYGGSTTSAPSGGGGSAVGNSMPITPGVPTLPTLPPGALPPNVPASSSLKSPDNDAHAATGSSSNIMPPQSDDLTTPGLAGGVLVAQNTSVVESEVPFSPGYGAPQMGNASPASTQAPSSVTHASLTAPEGQHQQAGAPGSPSPAAKQAAVQRLASVFTTLSDSVSVIVCMVGLPGRGKSFISKHVCRYLNWKGVPCRVFNAGDYRRQLLGAADTAGDAFYDPADQRAKLLREQMAELACEDAAKFINAALVGVAVLDATNTTRERRVKLHQYFGRAAPNARLLFIESVCTRQDVIRENILRAKLGNQDFAHVSNPQDVIDSFYRRIHQYEKVYESLDDKLEPELSYIRILNVKETVQLHNVVGIIPTRIAYFLLNLHPVAFPVYVCRHAETVADKQGTFGGDTEITPEGRRFANAFRDFALSRGTAGTAPLTVIYASNDEASVSTVAPLMNAVLTRHANINLVAEPRCLSGINFGNFANKTRQQANAAHPKIFQRLFGRPDPTSSSGGGAQPLIAPPPSDAVRAKAAAVIDAELAIVRTVLVDPATGGSASAGAGGGMMVPSRGVSAAAAAGGASPLAMSSAQGSAVPPTAPGATTPIIPRLGGPAFPLATRDDPLSATGGGGGGGLGGAGGGHSAPEDDEVALLERTEAAESAPMASPMPLAAVSTMAVVGSASTSAGGALLGVAAVGVAGGSDYLFASRSGIGPQVVSPASAATNPVPGQVFESHKYPAYNIGYPRGESTRQVVVRLEDVLMCVVRADGPVAIVCPDTPARGLLAYLCDLAPEQSQYVRLPHQTVVEVGTKGDVVLSTLSNIAHRQSDPELAT